MWETLVRSLGWEDPLEKGMALNSNILAWRIHGQRSQAGYSPWGCKKSDITEVTSHALGVRFQKFLLALLKVLPSSLP